MVLVEEREIDAASLDLDLVLAQRRVAQAHRERAQRPARTAQLRDDRVRLLDLGTKGSGLTPYSRTADGRLTLKGGVREVLATEMLEALGVNTSKSFALFETGEQLERGDEPSPTRSSVLTRLSHGHIRLGTFQRLAFFGQAENIKRLVGYCLENLYAEAAAKEWLRYGRASRAEVEALLTRTLLAMIGDLSLR